MIATPHVDIATAADLEAMAALRMEQGWQRSRRLLHSVWQWDGGRLFVVRESALDPNGTAAPVATISATAAGSFGVIGNVIVRSDYRRHGLGRLVMETALRWQRARGVRSVMLDATVDGRPLYFRLGFLGIEMSWFAHVPIAGLHRPELLARGAAYRTHWLPADALTQVAELDALAFGGDRLGLVANVLEMPQAGLAIAEDAATGAVSGYVVLRRLEPPYNGMRLGPWVARDAGAAAALLAAATSDAAPWRNEIASSAHELEPQLFASIPGTNHEAMDLWEAAGGALTEDDLIMQLDFDDAHGPTSIAATRSGPRPVAERPDWAYGWIAPMIF